MKKGTQTVIAGSIGLLLGLWFKTAHKEEKPCDCGCSEEKAVKDKARSKANQPKTVPSSKTSAYKAKSKSKNTAPSAYQASSTQKSQRRSNTYHSNQGTAQRSKSKAVRRTPQKSPYPFRYPALDYHQRLKGYRKAQVSFFNPTQQDQEVMLWGGNFNQDQYSLTDQWSSTVLSELSDIQSVAYNPVNSNVYLISQLGNSVWVLTPTGEIEAQIQMEANAYPGMSSPVSLTINTKVDSLTYGYAFAINSVADTLVVINPDHEQIHTIDLPARPIDIFFNEATNSLYVLTLLDGQLLQINAEDYSILQTVDLPYDNPITITAAGSQGDIYVGYLDGNAISTYASDLIPIEHIENVIDAPKHFDTSLNQDHVLVLQEDGQVLTFDTQTKTVSHTGLENVHFITTSTDGTYKVLRDNKEVIEVNDQWEAIEQLSVSATLMVSTDLEENPIVLFDAWDSQFYYYQTQIQGIEFDEGYQERKEDFKFNPAIIKHARVSLSGDVHFPTLKVINKRGTGKSEQRSLSMSDYQSPQHTQNIYDVLGLEGSFIDGHTAWQLRIAAGQRITFIVYYTQFEMYRLMPEHSRRAEPIM